MNTKFFGTPAHYRRYVLWMTSYVVAGIWGLFCLIKYAAFGETWMFGWKWLLGVAIFAVLFYRRAFQWIMQLDAQYGRGSGWTLKEVTVKLPEPRVRSGKSAAEG